MYQIENKNYFFNSFKGGFKYVGNMRLRSDNVRKETSRTILEIYYGYINNWTTISKLNPTPSLVKFQSRHGSKVVTTRPDPNKLHSRI